MEQVLNSSDFAAARAVSSTELKEIGFVPVCMEPGARNEGHSHTLVEEILIVKQGIGKIQIENNTYDLGPGSVAIIPAGRFHAVCNVGSENLEGFTVFNANFDRKKVVLKSRKEHFAGSETEQDALQAQVKALKKANKKLIKTIKKLKED